MKLTVDILDDFIKSLDLSGSVTGFSDDGTNTTLEVRSTYHARRGMFLNVDGDDYRILAVVNNTSIEVEGLIPNPLAYRAPNPFYFHGTPMMTNANHISGAKDADKTPMIYLYEILRERDMSRNSRVSRESDLRLFFLDNADFDTWDTDDHYSKRLVGLNNLVDAFEVAAEAYTCCFYLFETSFTRINHVNWGIWRDNSGHEKRIFDDNLTGVELSFTLPLRNCKQ